MGAARTFEDSPAVRSQVPLIVNIVGPSSSGKTFSALRLATGIQRVVGGDIYGVDTEAARMTHYADRFRFRHVPFGAPFDPLSYLAAVEHCARKGAKVVIVDSASHLHEGPGGVLEMHEAECQRLEKQWRQPREKVQISAWQKPKSELRRFINSILQMRVSLILCLRAKEKVKVIGGKPEPMGFMPIASDELIYEATLSCLLYPGSKGVPSWHPSEMGEKAIVKLPAQFEDMFREKSALSEDTGQKLAEWASGGQTGRAGAPAASDKTTEKAARPPGDSEQRERPWMKKLQAAVGELGLGRAEADEQGLKGEPRQALLRTRRLEYLSWCAGRDITTSDDLTDAEADLVIRRAEARDVPE